MRAGFGAPSMAPSTRSHTRSHGATEPELLLLLLLASR